MQTKYFNNFNGLRFFAAAAVVFAHNLHYLRSKNVTTYSNPHLAFAAIMAVRFFFVLSGFLIAYQLINEKIAGTQLGENIQVKAFYKNRMLRIWPLFYTLVLLVYFILPLCPWFQVDDYKGFYVKSHFTGFIMYMLFLPNLADLSLQAAPRMGHLWSIGVEEFFYVFFPLMVYLFSLKQLVKLLVIIIVVSAVFTFLAIHYFSYFKGHSWIIPVYVQRYQLGSFAFGILAAYAYIKLCRMQWVVTYKKAIAVSAYTLLLLNCVFVYYKVVADMNAVFYYLFFALMLLALALSNIRVFVLNNTWVRYLGKISFGIYMLQHIAIVLAENLVPLNIADQRLYACATSVVVMIILIALASISYYALELPFLKFRKKYLAKADMHKQ